MLNKQLLIKIKK